MDQSHLRFYDTLFQTRPQEKTIPSSRSLQILDRQSCTPIASTTFLPGNYSNQTKSCVTWVQANTAPSKMDKILPMMKSGSAIAFFFDADDSDLARFICEWLSLALGSSLHLRFMAISCRLGRIPFGVRLSLPSRLASMSACVLDNNLYPPDPAPHKIASLRFIGPSFELYFILFLLIDLRQQCTRVCLSTILTMKDFLR
jgi:hypothetical protein